MTQVFDHRLYASFLLWLDHEITQNLSGFSTITGQFYPISSKFSSKVYASPYKGIVSDSSISGATVLTGIYSGTTLLDSGDGLKINYEDGLLIFPTGVSLTPTGTYSVKDFIIRPCPDAEEKVLFETKYVERPKVNQPFSGLGEGQSTYPIIWIKYRAGENQPFQLGGTDETNPMISAIVIADSEYKLMAVDGLLRDKAHKYFTLLNSSELPFNEYGGLKSGSYNYDNIVNAHGATDLIYFDQVKISELPAKLNLEIGKQICASIVDFYCKVVK